MVAVWEFTSFWQFDIIFCSVLNNHASVKQGNVNIKHMRMTSLTSFLRGYNFLSLLRPMLPLVRDLLYPMIAIFLKLSLQARIP